MHGRGKSDSFVVPGKSPNKAGQRAAAEAMEGRRLAKGNAVGAAAHRTQRREWATSGLDRVRQAAKEDRKAAAHLGESSVRRRHSGQPGWLVRFVGHVCHPWPPERLAVTTQGRTGRRPAVCGSSASPDLCGGRPATGVPTATSDFQNLLRPTEQAYVNRGQSEAPGEAEEEVRMARARVRPIGIACENDWQV